MLQINLLDTALLIILLFFSIKGLIRGLVQDLAALLGVRPASLLAYRFRSTVGR